MADNEGIMTEERANGLAEMYGGVVEDTGGGIIIVTKILPDGRYLVFGGDSMGIYASKEFFENGESPVISICIF